MIRWLTTGLLSLLLCASVQAAAPSADANAAFDRYVKAVEDEMNRDKGPENFLWLDRHRDEKTRVWLGNITVRPLDAPEPSIQHWLGAIYLDNVTLQQVHDVVISFATYNLFVPEQIKDSKLIKKNGDQFDFQWRLYNKKLSGVLLNVNFTATYTLIDPTRMLVACRSTHVGEVEHAKDKKAWDKEKPPEDEAGYLQRVNYYWRAEQADDGTYVEFEMISLGREKGGLSPGRFIRGFEKYPNELTNALIEAMQRTFPHRR